MDRRSLGKGLGEMAALGFLALLAIGCGDSGPSAERIAAGRELYLTTCAVCHGPDAKGIMTLGKDLHDNEFVKSLSDDELVAFLAEGRPATHPLNQRHVAMPPRGGNPSLSDEELGLIADYLRSIQPGSL
ncbi:MAG: cytochrome c [bacterium]|nr:cytochrome c [bacterium]